MNKKMKKKKKNTGLMGFLVKAFRIVSPIAFVICSYVAICKHYTTDTEFYRHMEDIKILVGNMTVWGVCIIIVLGFMLLCVKHSSRATKRKIIKFVKKAADFFENF